MKNQTKKDVLRLRLYFRHAYKNGLSPLEAVNWIKQMDKAVVLEDEGIVPHAVRAHLSYHRLKKMGVLALQVVDNQVTPINKI